MSKYSDHKKPQFDLTKYLPEVYRSDVNNGVFNMAFNRHFTKDDTQRVAGIIGESSPSALLKRQIQEATPHRQAYQLAPTMYGKIGTVESSLSYKAFLEQLELMGVSQDRLPEWADTLQFNWVPPINIDMFVNYADYFWNPQVQGEDSQYFTIENRCSKLKSKLSSYETMLEIRGSDKPVTKIIFVDNSFVIEGRHDDLFVAGFVFFTNSTNSNIGDRFWTVASATFDDILNQTTIEVIEPIAIVSNTQPTTDVIGRWWYNSTTATLRQWNGSAWVGASASVAAVISLAELRSVYQSETNCACSGSIGWDMGPWDDNQIGSVIWDSTLFSTPSNPNPAKRIDFATEAEWLSWNASHPQTPPVVVSGDPVQDALWYDTTNDQLKAYVEDDELWIVTANNFSAIRANVTGTNFWDKTVGCEPQVLNQWSEGNRWIHKTQVQSFGGVKRAQLPILEFNSALELNQWLKVDRTWKYRNEVGESFNKVDSSPVRLELEPIKGYRVASVGTGLWDIYLFDTTKTTCREADHTAVFVPGFQFKIVDDTAHSDTYTVAYSQYRMLASTDPAPLQSFADEYMCTVVRIAETDFVSTLVGGGGSNVRIEPRFTSRGTPWRGYHIHWLLDESVVTSTPQTNQPWNIHRINDTTEEPLVEAVAGNSAYTSINFQPAGIATIELGTTYQQMVMSIPNVRTIDLVPKFRCNATATNFFAMPNTNELRVYVNGVRQYGNYAERTSFATPDYTLVGSVGHAPVDIEYVIGIDFDRPLKALDTVRLEVGPAAHADVGMFAVPVRTVEDEDAFTAGVSSGTQPVYKSLTSNLLVQQAKTKSNQYPIFNVYDVITGDVIQAAEIFAYKESSDAPINTILQRRLMTAGNAIDYVFEQTLVDRDDNIIYGYRDSSIELNHWYNPTTQQVVTWDTTSQTWALDFPVESAVTSNTAYRRFVVSDQAPTLGEGPFYWFDTRQNKFFSRELSSDSWQELGGIVSVVDPSLRTIWRHGKNNERAIPTYVDKDRNVITVGSPEGDWSLVDQWTYNPQHQNKKVLKMSELITHFNTMIKAQPPTPGLQGGGVYALAQSDYNYALGGTIKEHNDSFDTLISAVNVTNITPLGVIENAAREYGSSLLQIRDSFMKMGPTILTDTSNASIVDFSQFVTSQILTQYQQNDSFAQIFGDSSAYDPESGLGVKNWVATAPMFGLAEKFKPHLNKTGTFVELVHHDGHRSVVSLTPAEFDKLARTLCNSTDPRVSNPLGVISTLAPPATETAITSAFGGMRRGVYWYRVTSGVRKLYRLEMFTAGTIAPPNIVGGITLPDGTMYYNIGNKAVYSKDGGGWNPITAINSGDITPLWVETDLSVLYGEVLLEIEQRLYEVTPDQELVFDFDTLTSTSADQTLYDKLSAERFAAYARNSEITAPLVNVQYDIADPFSWNYSSCTFDVNPSTATPSIAASWQELYTRAYGTPYPHLEPWKLQGFTDKPHWWDGLYKSTNSTRRWIYTHNTSPTPSVGMWENIRRGIVPTGELLADGLTVSTGAVGQAMQYNYFCVNIANTTIGGFPPDSLLPPYFATIDPADTVNRSMFFDFSTQISGVDSDFTFGDGSPVEWEWKTSLAYVYDQLIIAFMMQPMRFLHASFGPKYGSVDGLQVELLFKQVYSHQDTMFHGDVYDVNKTYESRGLNQWYVNFNRRSGFNTNGEFREMWAGWEPKMTYQFGGIVDTNTFEIANKYIDIIPHDYNILLVNNGVFKDLWVDAFEVSLLNIPPPLIQYNNQGAWKMELDSLASSSRTINYYGVKEYSQMPDPVLLTPMVVQTTANTNEFIVNGNQLAQFPPGTEFDVSNSDEDDGTYHILDATYNATTNKTHLVVAGAIPSAS